MAREPRGNITERFSRSYMIRAERSVANFKFLRSLTGSAEEMAAEFRDRMLRQFEEEDREDLAERLGISHEVDNL